MIASSVGRPNDHDGRDASIRRGYFDFCEERDGSREGL